MAERVENHLLVGVVLIRRVMCPEAVVESKLAGLFVLHYLCLPNSGDGGHLALHSDDLFTPVLHLT